MNRILIELNKLIMEKVKIYGINIDRFSLDDICKVLMDEKINDLLEILVDNCQNINKKSFNICNKFEYELIEFYLHMTDKKIIDDEYNADYDTYKICESSYRIFSSEISQYKFLSKENEKKLLISYKKNNDKSSRDLLIASYQMFIIKMARRISNDEHMLLDLIQCGNIGLLNAIESYDLSYDCRLYNYAYYGVLREMTREFYKNEYSGLYNCNIIELKRKLDKYILMYTSLYNNSPTDDEIMKELDISKELLKYVKKSSLCRKYI